MGSAEQKSSGIQVFYAGEQWLPMLLVSVEQGKHDPFSFSMLMDVQGVIHATTGILPAKALSIPPEQYAEALEKIAVTFLVAPFMSEKDKVKLGLKFKIITYGPLISLLEFDVNNFKIKINLTAPER